MVVCKYGHINDREGASHGGNATRSEHTARVHFGPPAHPPRGTRPMSAVRTSPVLEQTVPEPAVPQVGARQHIFNSPAPKPRQLTWLHPEI